MNGKAQRIIEAINEVIAMDDVQPGFADANGNTNTTWCNRALHRMLVMLGGHADLLLERRGIGWTNANAMASHARTNCRPALEPEAAQKIANEGRLVAAVAFNAVGRGHVALVCPMRGYNAARGPLVGEAGLLNRIEHVDRAFFGLFPEYYEIPLESGCSA